MKPIPQKLSALLFAALAFAALYRQFVLRDVYPGYFGNFYYVSYGLASLWSLGIFVAWRGSPGFAASLAVGYLAALAYGASLMGRGGSALVGIFFVIAGLAGITVLSRLYLAWLPGRESRASAASPERDLRAAGM